VFIFIFTGLLVQLDNGGICIDLYVDFVTARCPLSVMLILKLMTEYSDTSTYFELVEQLNTVYFNNVWSNIKTNCALQMSLLD